MTRLVLQNLRIDASSTFTLSDISTEFKAGELTGIIGPNGAGKSTLAKAMVGLVALSNGEILLNDTALNAISLQARATIIGYLPQLADFSWRMSVGEAVALGRYAREPSNHDFNRVIAECGLSNLVERDVMALSGGEKMRVHLARTFYGQHDVIVADEPCASLDVAHQHRIMSLMRKHSRRQTAIVIIHDLDLAQRYCDRILLLQDGKLLLDGSPSDVLQSEICARAFGVEFQAYAATKQTAEPQQLLVVHPYEHQ